MLTLAAKHLQKVDSSKLPLCGLSILRVRMCPCELQVHCCCHGCRLTPGCLSSVGGSFTHHQTTELAKCQLVASCAWHRLTSGCSSLGGVSWLPWVLPLRAPSSPRTPCGSSCTGKWARMRLLNHASVVPACCLVRTLLTPALPAQAVLLGPKAMLAEPCPASQSVGPSMCICVC